MTGNETRRPPERPFSVVSTQLSVTECLPTLEFGFPLFEDNSACAAVAAASIKAPAEIYEMLTIVG